MKDYDILKPKTARIGVCMARYGLGRTAMERVANEAGACIDLGARVKLYDIKKIDDYLAAKSK